MMNWDHVRCFLALIRYGSASEAARHLEVNHTTITRRLRSLEKTLGVTLARHDSDEGWVLTDAGAEVFVVAEQIGESFAELERWVEDRNKQLAGSVRLALPRPMLHLLMPVLAHIADRHPDMAIELHERPLFEGTLPDNVDMALCVTSSPDLDLIGRRIATLRCGIYTAADAKTLGPGDRSLKRLKWVGVHPNSPGASHLPIARWMDAHIKPHQVRLQVRSISAMLEAITCGVGVGLLPCFIVEPLLGHQLARIDTPPEMELPSADLWLLTHPGTRSARTRPVRNDIARMLIELRAVFSGAKPQAFAVREAEARV